MQHLSIAAFAVFLAVAASGIVRAWLFALLGLLRKAPDMQSCTASVIIAAQNEERVLGATLAAVMGDAAASEIIVVDDGSTDNTANVVLKAAMRDARVRLLRQPQSGKAAALNQGIAAAREPVAVCIDADACVEPGAVAALASRLQDTALGAVAGCYLAANRSGLMPLWQELDYHIVRAERRGLDALGCQHVISGCLCAVRTVAVQNAGGFSSATIAEDFDLTVTLQRHGWRTGYEPRAVARIDVPATLGQWLRQRRRWVHGALQVCGKHAGALFVSPWRVGWIVLPHVWLQRVLLPLTLPVIDLWPLWLLLRPADGIAGTTAIALVAYHGSEWSAAFLEQRLQPVAGNGKLLWFFPLYRLTHRWLLWWTNVRQTVLLLAGRAEAWHRIERRQAAIPTTPPRVPNRR